jgi:hypothetical protein
MTSAGDGSAEVRAVVQRVHGSGAEARARRRLEAQSKGRKQLDLAEYKEEVAEREMKNLINFCKSGKISANQLKRLSTALLEPGYCLQFQAEDGCLHGLVGLISGKDSSKQILAMYCLANLTIQDTGQQDQNLAPDSNLAGRTRDSKQVQIARFSGPYLITMLSGNNSQLVELACTVLVNLTRSTDKQTHKVLLNQQIFPNLLNLAQSAPEPIQELSFQSLYHLVTNSDLEADSLTSLSSLLTSNLSVRSPIQLLWVVFSLSANQMLHSQFSKPQMLDTLLQISTYEIFQKCDSRPLVKVLTPIIRILGNLAAGPDSVEVCLHLVKHPDFPAILTALLSTNYSSLCQETVWLLANIVNQENVLVQEEFIEQDLMDKLENVLLSAVTRLDPYSVSRS